MSTEDKNKENRLEDSRTFSVKTSAGFTLIELLVVISIIGVLASLIVGISGVASTKKKISATMATMSRLETAIESYKASVGSYPPDAKFANGQVNSVTNQLFYELGGTVYRNRLFVSNQGGEGINRQVCRSLFGVDGIQNTATQESNSKSFVELGNSDFAPFSGNADNSVKMLVGLVKWPQKDLAGVDSRGRLMSDYRPIKSNDPALRILNPVQYRSSGRDRFNLTSFDLWIDVPIGGKIHRVNNWSPDKLKVISRADK
ncbi:MAG: type II secretion system protein [Verrucomicrobia bacterium]|jgi:prepilin-type N-terminal cleavage/methylation domain-containing protein|nr:type II secretion system protein [Verrucomicrobiota bacterium]MDB4746173.1 type II secretion system GspH family protein [Verrucomicrobiota bacterium]